jgi:hypothetical protein
MLHLDHHLPRDRLRVGQRLEHVVHRPAGHAGILQQLQPMRGGLRPEPVASSASSAGRFAIRPAFAAKARVADELGRAERLQHAGEVLLVGAADHDPAVGRLEGLVGSVQRMRRAHGARRFAGRERDGDCQ